jgi:hypothetical protein
MSWLMTLQYRLQVNLGAHEFGGFHWMLRVSFGLSVIAARIVLLANLIGGMDFGSSELCFANDQNTDLAYIV